MVKIVLKNLYKHKLSSWEKKPYTKMAKKIFWDFLHHLTAKFSLKFSSVIHSNLDFPLFQKPKGKL